jgi:hypothetical protein
VPGQAVFSLVRFRYGLLAVALLALVFALFHNAQRGYGDALPALEPRSIM